MANLFKTFGEDFARGQAIQKLTVQAFKIFGWSILDGDRRSRYDWAMQYKHDEGWVSPIVSVELKREFKYEDSNYICVEYEMNGNSSGIMKSRADVTIHIMKTCAIYSTWKMKDLMHQILTEKNPSCETYEFNSGGDYFSSKFVLINKDWLSSLGWCKLTTEDYIPAVTHDMLRENLI